MARAFIKSCIRGLSALSTTARKMHCIWFAAGLGCKCCCSTRHNIILYICIICIILYNIIYCVVCILYTVLYVYVMLLLCGHSSTVGVIEALLYTVHLYSICAVSRRGGAFVFTVRININLLLHFVPARHTAHMINYIIIL